MKEPWWAMLLVVVAVIVGSVVLVLNGNTVPDWFRDVAFVLVGGSAGNALPKAS